MDLPSVLYSVINSNFAMQLLIVIKYIVTLTAILSNYIAKPVTGINNFMLVTVKSKRHFNYYTSLICDCILEYRPYCHKY